MFNRGCVLYVGEVGYMVDFLFMMLRVGGCVGVGDVNFRGVVERGNSVFFVDKIVLFF